VSAHVAHASRPSCTPAAHQAALADVGQVVHLDEVDLRPLEARERLLHLRACAAATSACSAGAARRPRSASSPRTTCPRCPSSLTSLPRHLLRGAVRWRRVEQHSPRARPSPGRPHVSAVMSSLRATEENVAELPRPITGIFSPGRGNGALDELPLRQRVEQSGGEAQRGTDTGCRGQEVAAGDHGHPRANQEGRGAAGTTRSTAPACGTNGMDRVRPCEGLC
jgi:hypothetical protein